VKVQNPRTQLADLNDDKITEFFGLVRTNGKIATEMHHQAPSRTLLLLTALANCTGRAKQLADAWYVTHKATGTLDDLEIHLRIASQGGGRLPKCRQRLRVGAS
jgi:hypothetical protein